MREAEIKEVLTPKQVKSAEDSREHVREGVIESSPHASPQVLP